MARMSLAGARMVADQPTELALADARTTLSWAQLDETLNRAVNALLARDLGPDRQVAVFAANAAETVIAHLAGILAGLSTVPVNSHLTASEVAYILSDSGARLLFVGPETAEAGLEAARQAGGPEVIGWRCEDRPGVESFEQSLADAPKDEPPTELRPLPHLHYTSGTTGQPKGTRTPPTMFVGGDTIVEHLDLLAANPLATMGGRALVVGPLYHTGPLGSVRTLAVGTALVVLDRFDPEAALAAIERHKITSITMVPTHFVRLLALPEQVRARYDVSSLQLVAHTGAACPIDVKRAMIEWWGPVFLEAYGATESGTTNFITSPEWLEHPGSVGRTIPPFEVVVIGEDGEELGPDQVGRLYFRDQTGRGIVYHNDPEKTAAAHLAPGVFTLGEIGYVDADGYVYITDRVSDMVVAGGVNVYPAEAELVLAQHPAVQDVACIGVPDADLGEALKALVVPVDRARPPGAQELIDFCRERLAPFKCPRTVELVDDLGRNAMGKLNKRALRAPYWPSDRTIGG
jgi:acyl-CoA synthetase (AMP-forming)/AMP-acid ligase II